MLILFDRIGLSQVFGFQKALWGIATWAETAFSLLTLVLSTCLAMRRKVPSGWGYTGRELLSASWAKFITRCVSSLSLGLPLVIFLFFLFLRLHIVINLKISILSFLNSWCRKNRKFVSQYIHSNTDLHYSNYTINSHFHCTT